MTATRYEPTESALILVDVLNEFLAEDGKLNGMLRLMLDKLALLPRFERLVTGVRRVGLPIVYAPHGQDEHSYEGIKHLHPRMQMARDNKVFWKDSRGADFFAPLAPEPGDIVVSRHGMFNAFNGTDLDEQLKALGIKKIILAGLTSHTCIEGAGRHALEAGYHLTFLTDAVADFTEEAHRAAVEVAYPTFGHQALTVDEFLRAIEPASSPALATVA